MSHCRSAMSAPTCKKHGEICARDLDPTIDCCEKGLECKIYPNGFGKCLPKLQHCLPEGSPCYIKECCPPLKCKQYPSGLLDYFCSRYDYYDHY